MNLTGIRPYFSKIISATQVKEGKPSPDIYLYACEQLGLLPEECMAVEDAPNGILAAYGFATNDFTSDLAEQQRRF